MWFGKIPAINPIMTNKSFLSRHYEHRSLTSGLTSAIVLGTKRDLSAFQGEHAPTNRTKRVQRAFSW